eukprot:191264-Amphidinium_carterae.1
MASGALTKLTEEEEGLFGLKRRETHIGSLGTLAGHQGQPSRLRVKRVAKTPPTAAKMPKSTHKYCRALPLHQDRSVLHYQAGKTRQGVDGERVQ